MGATKIPSECLWLEGWPVWGYRCAISFLPPNQKLLPTPLILINKQNAGWKLLNQINNVLYQTTVQLVVSSRVFLPSPPEGKGQEYCKHVHMFV